MAIGISDGHFCFSTQSFIALIKYPAFKKMLRSKVRLFSVLRLMLHFYVYILFSPSSDIYYVGSTDNYKRRLEEHNSLSNKKFTSSHRPWQLQLVLDCGNSRSLAVHAERFIKRQKSKLFIQRIINGEVLKGSLAQLVRVPLERD